MKAKNIFSIPVWTNIFFLVPFVVAWRHDLYGFALFLIVVMGASTAYHYVHTRGKAFSLLGLIDIFCALILVLWSLSLLKQSLPLNIYSWLALIIFIIVLALFRKQYHNARYSQYHGLWHLFASLGIVCCELSFIHS